MSRYTNTLQAKSNKNTWNGLKEAILSSEKETIPTKKKQKHPWWTSECDKAIEDRRQAWLHWNNRKSDINHQNLLTIRKQTAKVIRATKRNFNKQQIKEID